MDILTGVKAQDFGQSNFTGNHGDVQNTSGYPQQPSNPNQGYSFGPPQTPPTSNWWGGNSCYPPSRCSPPSPPPHPHPNPHPNPNHFCSCCCHHHKSQWPKQHPHHDCDDDCYHDDCDCDWRDDCDCDWRDDCDDDCHHDWPHGWPNKGKKHHESNGRDSWGNESNFAQKRAYENWDEGQDWDEGQNWGTGQNWVNSTPPRLLVNE
ncbi:hypothetical protein G9A89_001447 [Geosiphon pyriformis]|nr:hypothetical protein G9A89_001447 [Geosiphon pyriformis]